jgi:hypothetical protein
MHASRVAETSRQLHRLSKRTEKNGCISRLSLDHENSFLSPSKACSSDGKIQQARNLRPHAACKSPQEFDLRSRDNTSHHTTCVRDTNPDKTYPHKPYPFPTRSSPSVVKSFPSQLCDRQDQPPVSFRPLRVPRVKEDSI